MATKFPSFASDPAYAAAVLEANQAFQGTLGDIGQQQSHLLLQLGNPQLAKAIYSTNWMTSRKKKRGGGMPGHGHGAMGGAPPGGGYFTQQMTPYERNQMRAIRASANPETGTSTFAKIGRQFNLQEEAMNNELNAANLFYSGYRGKQLGQLGREKQFAQSDALFGAQQTLDQQRSALTQARTQRRTALVSAAEAAYQRLLAQRLGGN